MATNLRVALLIGMTWVATVVLAGEEGRSPQQSATAEAASTSNAPRQRSPRVRATQLPQLEALARQDLATRVKAQPKEVRVLERVPTHWTLAELECREPSDTSTAQIAGYKLYLRYRRHTYTYHTDDARVFACPAISLN